MTIDRYLASQLLVKTVLVLAALLVVLALLEFIDEVQDLDEVYTLAQVGRYLWLIVPGDVYEFLPIAVLIGGMLSLGNLTAQSEMIAFRAAGYSRIRIIFSVLGVGCLFALFTALLGETLVPTAESAAARMHGDGERPGMFQETRVGIWSREGRNFIHAREAGEGDLYLGVSIYEIGDDNGLERVISGDSMRIESDRFVLNEVHDVRISEQGVTFSQQPKMVIARAAVLEKGVLGAAVLQSMNTFTLLKYIDFLKRSSLRHDYHELTLWTRLSQPLSVLVMLLLALPFAFAPVRSSAGQRLFYGIMVGLTYLLISSLFSNLTIAFEFAPALGALAPLLAYFAVGLYRLSRSR